VSPSTDPVRPHRPAGSTHHDDANATQPTQHHPSLLAAPGRPRWSLPKCWKSAPIIHPTSASETHLPACDRPKLSSCHSSSMVPVPTRTITRAVNRHQISIDRAAAASLPSATSCIAGLPTPADAGCGCGSPRPASANLYTYSLRNGDCAGSRTRLLIPTKLPRAGARVPLTLVWGFFCQGGAARVLSIFSSLSFFVRPVQPVSSSRPTCIDKGGARRSGQGWVRQHPPKARP